MKMAHACARVKDLEALTEFYQKVFGFGGSRRRDSSGNKFTLAYLILPGNDYELELTYNHDHGAYDLGDGYGRIAIAADDLGKLHEQHEAADLGTTSSKELPGTAFSCYFVINPDSYKIEVIRG